MKVKALKTIKPIQIPFMDYKPRIYLTKGEDYEVLDVKYNDEQDKIFYLILCDDGYVREYPINLFNVVWEEEELNIIVNRIFKDIDTTSFSYGCMLGCKFFFSYIEDTLTLKINVCGKNNVHYTKVTLNKGMVTRDLIKRVLTIGFNTNTNSNGVIK